MATGSWDYSMFWNEAIDRIKQEVSPQEASMWFENLQYLDSKESEIRIAVPSSFYRDQVKQRYLSLISETLHDLSGKTFTLEFVVQPSKKNTASSKETKQQDNPSSSGKKIPAAKRGHAQLKP
ncbi:MAG: chromosomal replication initiator protein DnaA, partial [Spirochaetales bacterium]|nr:chromosomal replication initiator protein DnaA [Spirochaetales bacterium]